MEKTNSMEIMENLINSARRLNDSFLNSEIRDMTDLWLVETLVEAFDECLRYSLEELGVNLFAKLYAELDSSMLKTLDTAQAICTLIKFCTDEDDDEVFLYEQCEGAFEKEFLDHVIEIKRSGKILPNLCSSNLITL